MKIENGHIATSAIIRPERKTLRNTSIFLRQRFLCGRTSRYYTGKERDSETGLHYYGARYLDSRTGRWLSGDPAVGEYVPQAGKGGDGLPGMGGVYNTANLHLYHYAGNNPIKYTDPDGRAAGDEFEDAESAAFDFANTYNPDSIATGREYGSTIYSYASEDGSTKYSYTVPNRGPKPDKNGNQGVNVSKPTKGQTAVATIHTHGNLDLVDRDDQAGANYPSHTDEKKAKLPTYVVGPSGVLSVFDPKTMDISSPLKSNAKLLTTPENNNIPKDRNDTYNPGNTNFADRNNYTPNPYKTDYKTMLLNGAKRFWGK